MQSSIMIDAAVNGDLITTEADPVNERMRISKLTNPFRLKPLYEISFEAVSELYPSISKNPALLRLQNIHNYGGCILFS